MAIRMDELQAELKQARVLLANSTAENDRLAGLCVQLKKVRHHLAMRRTMVLCIQVFLTTYIQQYTGV